MLATGNRHLILKTVFWNNRFTKFSSKLTNSSHFSHILVKSHNSFIVKKYSQNNDKCLIQSYSYNLSTRYFNTIKESYHYNDTSNRNNKINDQTNGSRSNKSWKLMKYGIIIFGISTCLMCLKLIYEINKPNYDANGMLVEDEFSNLPHLYQIYKRVKKELVYYKKLVQEPSRDKLLPDPLQHPYTQPSYTLVLELTDVLVHPDWTYQTGWRFKKRPGVDTFLQSIASPMFEIVVYTAEQGLTIFPILDALDSNGHIMYRLFRDATRFVDGHHVKDLDALNRDLSKVIVIDWNSESVKYHSENMLKIPRWNGNDDDTTLYDLALFLKTIYDTNVQDVREVLHYYQQFENPLETFRENQRKLLEQLEEEENKAQNKNQTILKSKWKPFFLRNYQ